MTIRTGLLFALAPLLLAAQAASAAPVYRVVELPVRHIGGSAAGISGSGTVAVNAIPAPQICVKDRPGCKKLPTFDDNMYFTISAVNDRGVSVGSARSKSRPRDVVRAVWWSHGDVRDLGTFNHDPSLSAWATGVNDAGLVVGMGTINHAFPAPDVRAFVWQDGVMRILPTLSGGKTAEAWGINSAGVVVGGSAPAFDTSHAFTYNFQTQVMTDMGCGTGYRCVGMAINELGDIAAYGFASLYDTTWLAMRSVGGVLQTLPHFPGDDLTIPYGINDQGDVVGYCQAGKAGRGFIFTDADGLLDLQTVLRKRDQATYRIVSAHGINNAREIAASALRVADGITIAVRLEPIQ